MQSESENENGSMGIKKDPKKKSHERKTEAGGRWTHTKAVLLFCGLTVFRILDKEHY